MSHLFSLVIKQLKTLLRKQMNSINTSFPLLNKYNQSNQIKYLLLLQVYIGPINSILHLHVKNRQ